MDKDISTQHIQGGAFQLARVIFDHKIWKQKKPEWLKIWIYIIGNVQHTDFNELKRGQGFFNLSHLVRVEAFGNGVTAKQVEGFIEYARKEGMIEAQKATHGILITVCHYNLYQTLDNYEIHQDSDEKEETKRKQDGDKGGNINKNEDELKNKEKQTVSLDYLISLPSKDVDELYEIYGCTKTQIIGKAKELHFQYKEKGIKSTPQALLKGALSNQYGLRKSQPVYKDPSEGLPNLSFEEKQAGQKILDEIRSTLQHKYEA